MTRERILAICMTAFRGVRDSFELDLGGRSLLVLGPNATGKSSIADAVEWHLEGEIELLRHEGRQEDVRHIGAAESVPTFVSIMTTGELSGETWESAELGPTPRRRVSGETYLLRGRTLAEFVNLTKGGKWKRVASLLGLGDVDRLRLDMQTVNNRLQSALESGEEELRKLEDSAKSLWSEMSKETLWEAIQDACEVAGIRKPASLEEALDPAWSSTIAEEDPAAAKAKRIERVMEELAAAPDLGLDVDAWNSALRVRQDPQNTEFRLLEAARGLLSTRDKGNSCPLCLQAVDRDELVESVAQRLSHLYESSKVWEQAEAVLLKTRSQLHDVLERRRRVIESGREVGLEFPELPEAELDHLVDLANDEREFDELEVALARGSVAEWDEEVSTIVDADPAADIDRVTPIVRVVLLAERGRAWRDAAVRKARAQLAAERACALFEAITEKQTELVDQILSAISEPLADIYSALHPDEALESAAVEQWGEKGLELSVEYHGERRRPPHGVLSESHLNSLAIAVFLAMAEAFNEKVGFLVLDDVVSSFDIEHRGDLAELLVERYEDWQIIILTHDRLFFERVRKLAPSWQALEFTSWDFEEGPRLTSYVTSDQIARARAGLEKGDVAAAATAARRALEEALQEVCEGIGAPVPFRRGSRNDRREAQELLTGVLRVVKGLDAESRGTMKEKLQRLETDLQTALNPEAHASQEWASLGEVREAVDRIEKFIGWWTCAKCGTRIWHNWSGTAGSCKCGASQIPSSAPK